MDTKNITKKIIEDDYIFCYFLTKNNDYLNEIKKFATKHNLKIITPSIWSNTNANSLPCDPFDFLNLIKNSTYIFTDSFHGMIFSINFQKQFAIYKRFNDFDPNSQNSRIINSLDLFSLSSRLVNNNLETLINNKINYKKIDTVLENYRKDSNLFLESSLEQSFINSNINS